MRVEKANFPRESTSVIEAAKAMTAYRTKHKHWPKLVKVMTASLFCRSFRRAVYELLRADLLSQQYPGVLSSFTQHSGRTTECPASPVVATIIVSGWATSA